MLPDISLDENHHSCKNQWSCWKEFERSQRYGIWFLTNNIDSHSIEWAVCNVYKHKVLRLRSTDWKSPLTLTRHTNIKSYHSFQSLSLHAAWILQMQVFWVLTKVLPTSGQLQPEMDWREGHICAFPFVPHVQWRTKNWHRCRCMVSFKLLLCPFQVSPERSLISFDTSNNKTKKIDKQKKTQPSGPSCSKAG